jgi:hypothetical protein
MELCSRCSTAVSKTSKKRLCQLCTRKDNLRQKEKVALAENQATYKVCKKCNKSKPLDAFHVHALGIAGRRTRCKECTSLESKKRYNRPDIKQRHKEWKKEYTRENKEVILEKSREYHSRPEVKEREKAYRKINRKNIRKKQTERKRIRSKTDVLFLVKERLRTNIRSSIRYRSSKKTRDSESILGCSWKKALVHLNIKSPEDLSGKEIDHICPLNEARTVEELYLLCHWSNLQILTKEENRSKGDSLTPVGLALRRALLGR